MRFEKISEYQFMKDNVHIRIEYDKIKIPKRATKCSAGYDFYSPSSFILYPGESIKLPTGIKVCLDDDRFLMIVPRSSLGFRYRAQLDNSVGIVDADYYNNAENEGHIWIKITNDSKDINNVMVVNQGDAIAQGIILKYYTVEDDESDGERTGGFGSTDKDK